MHCPTDKLDFVPIVPGKSMASEAATQIREIHPCDVPLLPRQCSPEGR